MIKYAYELKLNQDDQWHMPRPHFHDALEVLLSLSDGVHFFLNQSVYELQRGTLVFVPASGLHRSFGDKPVEYRRYVLHCPLYTLGEMSTHQTDLRSAFSEVNCCVNLDEETTDQLSRLMEACLPKKDDSFGADVQQNMHLTQLMLTLCQLLTTKQPIVPQLKPGLARVRPILQYIDQHLTEQLSLDNIAQACYFNKYYLCHVFKETTGFTVIEYLNRVRIQRSRTLLREGVSVREAGERTGFASQTHFIRTFKQQSGISPGQYARLNELEK